MATNVMDIDSEDDEYYVDHLDDPQEKTLIELSSMEKEVTKRKKKINLTFEVPGVQKVILDSSTQKSIGIEVGVDITIEQPWKCVKKELLFDSIAVLQGDSPFAPFKSDIETYEEDEILMGYIFQDENYSDEYYACLTTEAKHHCEVLAKKVLKKQMKKLESSIYKVARPWNSLGSENEINEFNVKTTRPLIKVEIKSIYPKPYQPKKFSDRGVDDVADGYMELVPTGTFENIFKKRLDCAVQAIPIKSTAEVQTDPKFPRNYWTQCNVEDDGIDVTKIGDSNAIIQTTNENKDSIEDQWKDFDKSASSMINIIQFNSILDIYNIDYPALIKDNNLFDDIEIMHLEEIMYLRDAKTKGKLVSSVAWHPARADLIAVAYADMVLGPIIEGGEPLDQLRRDMFGNNLVLIWSLNDSLYPKKYLESNREVKTISFCPHDENLLIGGCVNGQIVIWDLAGKLKERKLEPLTTVQNKFRTIITPKTELVDSSNNNILVHASAVSNLSLSHNNSVTDIVWLPKNIEIPKNGRINHLNDDNRISLQFFTASLDCNVLIWNIDIPENLIVNLKSNMPSAKVDLSEEVLNLNTSKYRVLNDVLCPVYKIMVGKPEEKYKMPLTSLFFNIPEFSEGDCINAANKYGSSSENVKDPPQIIWLTSLYGDVCKISWSGYEIETEKSSSVEYCNVLSRVKIHEGPIVRCVRNPFFKNIFATVGGKIFSIWSTELFDEPLFWKKVGYCLTNIMWSTRVPSQLYLTTQEGNLDIWDFLQRSDLPTKTQRISGGIINGVYSNKSLTDDHVVAIGDYGGSLRIFRTSISLEKFDRNKFERTELYFKRELEAKQIYHEWEKKWYLKHFQAIETKRQNELAIQREKERKLKVLAIKEQERRDIAAEKKKNEKPTVEGAEEKWKRMQWRHAIKLIQVKKRVTKSDLQKYERPLRDLESQRINVINKQCEILKNQEKVFNETVSILFPEAVTKTPEPLPIIPADEINRKRKEIMEDFRKTASEARKSIQENPFVYDFNWEKTLMKGKERRKTLETAIASDAMMLRMDRQN